MDLTSTRKTALASHRWLWRRGVYLVPFSAGLAILIWHLLARYGGFPAFILPSPALVWQRFLNAFLEGRFSTQYLDRFLRG